MEHLTHSPACEREVPALQQVVYFEEDGNKSNKK